MKQNIEIYLALHTKLYMRVVLVHGISVTEFFKFWRNLVIPIEMGEYCVKSGRTPPKSEWLAAMPHGFMLLLEFGSSPIWATVMLQISKCYPSDSCLLQYDSRTTHSRHLYATEV